MLKSISFKKLAVLTAGLAIVLSSCGLQNSASESSGGATAAGKTKNFALLDSGQWCYDTVDEQTLAIQAMYDQDDLWHNNPWDANGDGFIAVNWEEDDSDHGLVWPPKTEQAFSAQIGGCPAPGVEAANAEAAEEDPKAAAALYACVTPEIKQAMIDGYKEQVAKTDYPADWSAAGIAGFKAQMQKGLEIAELICTN